MDAFNGNLIISGAFGLFKKDVVIAAGGYASDTLDEDMELVIKLHAYCRQNLIDYQIRYEPDAVCWSQTPCSLRDLIKQRRRWHLGLFQCLMRYRFMFGKLRYGMAGTVSYLYYLLYELFSPQIELLGLLMVVLAGGMGLLNVPFMVNLFLLFGLYGSTLTMTAFFQRIYTQNLRIRPSDVLKACLACLAENIFSAFFWTLCEPSPLWAIASANTSGARFSAKKCSPAGPCAPLLLCCRYEKNLPPEGAGFFDALCRLLRQSSDLNLDCCRKTSPQSSEKSSAENSGSLG